MKSFKKTLLASVACLALLSSNAGAEPGKISDGVVKIGILTDMNGVYANVGGAGAIVAARMAIEDFGKRDVSGARIELVSADDQNRGDISGARTKEWIEKDKVDMITGMVATSSALGAMKEASAKGKLVFPTSATSTAITNQACNPHTILWNADTYGLSIGTVKALIESGQKSFFFVTADDAFGWGLEKDASDMVKALGGEVKGAVRAPFPGADFSEQLLAAKESGSQVVAFANAGLDAVGTTEQSYKLGLGQKQVIAPLLLFHQDVQSLGAGVLKDQLMTSAYVWNQSPQSIAFAKRYYARTQRMPDVGQAHVYSAVLQYLRAVDSIGSDDGNEVMKYFKDPGRKLNDAVLQDAYVRADGKLIKPIYVIRIKKPGEMAHAWDYYDIKKVIPGEEASIQAKDSVCPLLNTSLKFAAPAKPADAKPADAKPAPAKTLDAKLASINENK